MPERPDKHLIAGLIASAGARDLAGTLAARCWPRGSDERNAIAAEWLRRWQPRTATLSLPTCACPAGRCSACN
jgi:hypothetical protein